MTGKFDCFVIVQALGGEAPGSRCLKVLVLRLTPGTRLSSAGGNEAELRRLLARPAGNSAITVAKRGGSTKGGTLCQHNS
jgi:hypothetical protein